MFLCVFCSPAASLVAWVDQTPAQRSERLKRDAAEARAECANNPSFASKHRRAGRKLNEPISSLHAPVRPSG